jgi:hypothetical protein
MGAVSRSYLPAILSLVSHSLLRCFGRKLLKKASFRPAWSLVPGEFTVYKKGRRAAPTHELSENLI